ncbi:hypothetical protein GF325_17730, partial [Candidatus Bathyarchaeota archaeon]|nr:hypothetical protein [Candidatus Bathyarchaeota archaeon]
MANAKTGTVLSPSLLESWERAKLAWSKFTRLQDPLVLSNIDDIIEHQMQGVMAQIEMADLRVILNMISITQLKLENLLDVIMAHEVGHHVLAPGSLLNHVRLVSVISGILSGGQREFMVNIFTDLLVNDFLFTQRHMKVNEIYMVLKKRYEEASMEFGEDSGDAFWALYMRIYEILWRMPRGSMCNIGELTGEIERDAKLAARTLRTFSKKWFKCIKNLTYIFKGYLPEMTPTWEKAFAPSFDKIKPGKDALDKVWGFSKMSEEEAMKPTEKTYDGSLSDIFKGSGSREGQLPTQG